MLEALPLVLADTSEQSLRLAFCMHVGAGGANGIAHLPKWQATLRANLAFSLTIALDAELLGGHKLIRQAIVAEVLCDVFLLPLLAGDVGESVVVREQLDQRLHGSCALLVLHLCAGLPLQCPWSHWKLLRLLPAALRPRLCALRSQPLGPLCVAPSGAVGILTATMIFPRLSSSSLLCSIDCPLEILAVPTKCLLATAVGSKAWQQIFGGCDALGYSRSKLWALIWDLRQQWLSLHLRGHPAACGPKS
mmetsp:Transcript_32598/g.82408  ORF Transcript_32598/g.82408 Transcript_32598/m.82408 type:complete len:249 (-) Transcript_32598:251-997(-)